MQKELDALVREVLPLDRGAMAAAEEDQARLARGGSKSFPFSWRALRGKSTTNCPENSFLCLPPTTAWWPRAFPARRSP